MLNHNTFSFKGVYIARKARLIEPQNDVIIANSINNGEIEWVSAADDSSVRSPKVTDLESFSQATTLAMTGEVWQYLLEFYPSTAAEYAKYTKVFGRCTPNDKVSIVTTFVELGEICLMW
jgi:magnesium-transporting ATPase (P-type)